MNLSDRQARVAPLEPLLCSAAYAGKVMPAIRAAIPRSVPLELDGLEASALQASPISYAQARLRFLQPLEPELTAYHLPAVWRLRGDLAVAALQRAPEGLIQRPATLRSSLEIWGEDQQTGPCVVEPLLLFS